MEFLYLKYFKQVAESLNYTQAAKELYISQPALSMTIKKLEKELNTTLFIKKGRSIELTENGHLLLKSVNRIFNELNRVTEVMQKNDAVKTRTIHFASSHARLMYGAFETYVKNHPENKYNMEVTDNRAIIQKLLSHDISFALNSIELTHPRIECNKLINEDIVLTYPKKYDYTLSTKGLYDDSIYKSFLFSSHNEEYNAVLQSFLDYKNIKVNNANYVDDLFMHTLLKERTNFCFLPISMCRELNLPYIEDPNLIISNTIYLSTLKDTPLSDADLNLYQFIEDYFKSNANHYII